MLLVLAAATASDAVVYAGSKSLAPWYNISWSSDTVTKRIELTVEARTTGWVGFGLAEAGGMRGADIFMASVSSTGVATSGDYYSIGEEAPKKDVVEDWTLLSANEANGLTSVKFSRAFDTGDAQDRPFVNRLNEFPQKILFAVGSIDELSYHGRHGRGNDAINFFSNHGGHDLLADIKATPGVFTKMFTSEDWAIPTHCTGRTDRGTVNVATGVFPFRSSCTDLNTQYAEFCLDLSHDNASLLIASEFVIDEANRDIVHHFVTRGYSQSGDCTGPIARGIGGWAPGEEYLVFPNNAGVDIGPGGGLMSLNMQLHYDNWANRAAVDSSGVRMWLLPKDAAAQVSRPLRTGGLQFGDDFRSYIEQSPMWLGYLPLGLSRFDFFCPGETTARQWADYPGGGGNVTYGRHHMHITGTALSVVVRKPDGSIRHKSRSDRYDFNFQGMRDEDSANPTTHEPTMRVMGGDDVTTTCWFDNRLPPLGRKVGDPSAHKWGLGSNDEMCTWIAMHTPAMGGSKNCRLGTDGSSGILKSVSVIAPWQEEDAFTEREFGRAPVPPNAPPSCFDNDAYSHPTLGACASFTAELCEVHGREVVGALGSSASSSCCVCKAITPPTCDDAYFHVRNSWSQPDKYNLTTCDLLVSTMASLGFECDARLDVAMASQPSSPTGPARVHYFFPDKSHTLAAVCPNTCGLCTGKPLRPSETPQGDGSRQRRVGAIAGGAVAVLLLAATALYVYKRRKAKVTSDTRRKI